jgi:hypothetical protein
MNYPYRSMMNIDGELAKLKPSVEAEKSKSSEWISFMQVPRGLPVLSDAAPGLVAFAQGHVMKYYLCFRHRLESMGTETYVAVLARHLLFQAPQESIGRKKGYDSPASPDVCR